MCRHSQRRESVFYYCMCDTYSRQNSFSSVADKIQFHHPDVVKIRRQKHTKNTQNQVQRVSSSFRLEFTLAFGFRACACVRVAQETTRSFHCTCAYRPLELIICICAERARRARHEIALFARCQHKSKFHTSSGAALSHLRKPLRVCVCLDREDNRLVLTRLVPRLRYTYIPKCIINISNKSRADLRSTTRIRNASR